MPDGLGPNPYEEPEEREPPEEERKVPPIVPTKPPKEREIPDVPYTVKDPYTGKDIDLVLKQGMFLWREDKLEGFFTKRGDFITTRPEETEPWERTRAFFSNIWRGLPVNPYFWKSPEAKWEADRKDALIAWAKEADVENPEEYVKDLLAKETKELAWEAYEPEEGRLRIPEFPIRPTGERVTVGERFVGEWVIPMTVLSMVGVSAIKGRAALEVAKVGKPAVVRAGIEVTRAALAPVAVYEKAVVVGLKYGVGVPLRGVSTVTRKAFEKALDLGLDRWLVRQGIRGDQASRVVRFFLEVNHRWLYQQAETSVKNKLAKLAATRAGTAAAKDVIKAAEPMLRDAIRSVTGKELVPITPAVAKPSIVPPVKPLVVPEVIVEGLATTAQKAKAHIVALDKALIDATTKKLTPQYRRLAQNITGKKSMVDMTSDEASDFIEALERYPEKKWSTKTGKWIPQAMPITKAIVPENYFGLLEFKEPIYIIKHLTSQNFYATKLGVGELTRPLELAKQALDLEYPAWVRAVELKIKDLNKVYKVTLAEKLVAIRNNVPTGAVADMAKLLNKYEDPPATLSEDKAKLFMWFRNVDRTILAGENRVRELLNMPLIPYRRAYLRHIADRTAEEIMRGQHSLPQDLAYWSKRIVGKKIYNPMEIQRQLADDLLEHFSKDLLYATKSMIWTGLKEIHLSQPLRAFVTQLNVLSKGMMPFSSLTGEELVRAQAVSVLPASTRKWVTDYVNIVIKGQQTELDASINRAFAGGLDAVFGKFLNYFGRSVGTRPVTKMAQFSGRLVISATIGTKPRQIIRNLWQSTQNLALYGIEPTLSAFLPAGKTLSRLLDNSMFLKSYARYEELPLTAMGKAERAWLWLYGKSAIFNAKTGMKAAYHGTIRYIIDPKNKGLGWADSARTYTEPKGFLYPSESEKLLREMEFGAGCTQYQYIAMGMPEVFRHKVLIPLTRLQSWWMNYFFKFNREAIHRFWTGSVGWDKNLKLPPTARLNWIKYVILGGAILTAMGYKRSFMKEVLPHWASPAGQMMVGAYSYIIADSDYERDKAQRTMFYSMRAFAPGTIDYKSWQDVWTGEKPMSSLFFYGEEWPPDMPTWGIPPLEKEVDIKNQINYANEEIARVKEQLGKSIPAEDDIEEYTYEMSDYASDIRGAIRDIPPERITKENGFSDMVLVYKEAEALWDTHYYSLPASQRQAWLQQQTPESIWTGAYLALWGKLKVTGWVSGNSQTIALIRQLVEEYGIPPEAIPSLGELEEREAEPEVPPVTPPTVPPREEGLGPNPYE